ncbi:MAG: TRAP transporter substrate-binding protein DctP [Alphaproteobacteria bacterium]|nr:TRAP transporter substrate-binding protein DctP [Alphaproteobacteria bacterium]
MRLSRLRLTRRKLAPAAAVAAAAVAAPAIAQQSGESVRWRLVSSFPKSLDTLFGAAQTISRVVGELTDGKFVVQPFAAGEIVPALQVLDAVSNATVECGHSYTGYYIGKNPSFIFDGSLPFGLTPRQHSAWLFHGGGRQLMEEVYDAFNVVAIPAGNTGGQMFGWFRKELKTPADFQGLKMRTAGFGGKVMSKLGVVPQQIPGGDIYPALERGTIDACEWVGPYDDEKLGFNKVAKYYYTPGVMEMEATNHLFIHKAAWNALSPRFQAALRYACNYAMTEMLATYDAKNAQAIARLVAAGTQLSVLPTEVVRALRVALEAVLDEEAAASPQFKKILENWRQFRADQHRWFLIADTRAELAAYNSAPR